MKAVLYMNQLQADIMGNQIMMKKTTLGYFSINIDVSRTEEIYMDFQMVNCFIFMENITYLIYVKKVKDVIKTKVENQNLLC